MEVYTDLIDDIQWVDTVVTETIWRDPMWRAMLRWDRQKLPSSSITELTESTTLHIFCKRQPRRTTRQTRLWGCTMGWPIYWTLERPIQDFGPYLEQCERSARKPQRIMRLPWRKRIGPNLRCLTKCQFR